MNKLREQLNKRGISSVLFYLVAVLITVLLSLLFRWGYYGTPFTDPTGIIGGVYGAYLVAAFSLGNEMQIGYSSMKNTAADGLSRMFGLVFGVFLIIGKPS